MKKLFLQSFRALIFFTFVFGTGYTFLMTGLAHLFFRHQSTGSLISRDGKIIGSALLAQKFEKPIYFWPRPSAADFATVPSGASNLGPTSATLKQAIEKRASDLRKAHELPADAKIPEYLLTTSASGLDPHLPPDAVRFQIERVAKARNFSAVQTIQLRKIVEDSIEGKKWIVLGELRINILLLNLKLDRFASSLAKESR